MGVQNVVQLEDRRSRRVTRTRPAGEELAGLDARAITKIACSSCGEEHRLMYDVERRDRWLCSVCDERVFVAKRARRGRLRLVSKVSALSVLAVLAWLLYRRFS